MKARKRKILSLQILIFLLFLGLWELAADLHLINSFVFSSPSRLCICFKELLLSQNLCYHISLTLAETIIAFLLVVILSLFLSIILWWNPFLAKVAEPYMVILNSLPKSALAPILIVWLGANMKTIIVCGISVAIFGSVLNMYTGFATIDSEQLKLIKTLKGNKLHSLLYVVLPANLPNILSILKVNIGLSLVGVIIGEFLASRAGLGYLIIYGSQTFKLDWVLLSIFILLVLAFALYELVGIPEKRIKNHF